MSVPTSSLNKVVAALKEHGWEFTVVEGNVRVPPTVPGWRGQTVLVPGFVLTASNLPGADYASHKNFTAHFTESGAYLPRWTKGKYPFDEGMTLRRMVSGVAQYSKAAIEERVAARDAEAAADQAKFEAEVFAAFVAAKTAENDAENALVRHFVDQMGMTFSQAYTVVRMVGEPDCLLTKYSAAKGKREQVGKGWLPGKTSLSGTFVDGVKVGD